MKKEKEKSSGQRGRLVLSNEGPPKDLSKENCGLMREIEEIVIDVRE